MKKSICCMVISSLMVLAVNGMYVLPRRSGAAVRPTYQLPRSQYVQQRTFRGQGMDGGEERKNKTWGAWWRSLWNKGATQEIQEEKVGVLKPVSFTSRRNWYNTHWLPLTKGYRGHSFSHSYGIVEIPRQQAEKDLEELNKRKEILELMLNNPLPNQSLQTKMFLEREKNDNAIEIKFLMDQLQKKE